MKKILLIIKMPPEQIFQKVFLVVVIFIAFIILRNLYRTYRFCGINPVCYWENRNAIIGMTRTFLTKDNNGNYTVKNDPDPKTGNYKYP